MSHYRLATLVGLLAAIISFGTVFFHYVEGWSLLDSYFFTVVTLSTVGYGELVPATPVGKIATTIFIITGLGIFAAAIQQFGHYAIRKRERHAETLTASLLLKDADSANRDSAPTDAAQLDTSQNGKKPSTSS